MKFQSLLMLLVLPMAIGCQATPEDEPPDLGPCGAVWGPEPSGGRIYVDPTVPSGGDGTLSDPMSSLFDESVAVDSALELAEADSVRAIAIASGELPTWLTLNASVSTWLAGGLEITGCGVGQTVLTETITDGSVPDIPAGTVRPILSVADGTTADVLVRDLTMQGGRRTVTIWNGAGMNGAIVLQRVTIEDSMRLGVLVDGVSTLARFEEVEVLGVTDDAGAFGYGMAVQIGAPLGSDLSNPVELDDVVIEDCVGVGLLVDGGHIDALGLEVRGTTAVGGELGRGVQLQNRSFGPLTDLLAENNADAAVFLRRPGRPDGVVTLTTSSLKTTLPSAVPDGATSGDGLVVLGLDDVAADTYVAVIDDVAFEGNPRSHVLIDGALLQIGVEPLFSKGTSFPFALQGGGLAESVDGGAPPVEPEVLDVDDALSLREAALVLDLLVE